MNKSSYFRLKGTTSIKNKKHLKKASLILQKIKSENSLRGVIFNTLQREGTSYWFKNYISRKDLRKILVLK